MSVIQEAVFAADPSSALRQARAGDDVVIESDDGTQYAVTVMRRPAPTQGRSPLDVGTVPGLHLTIDEINDLIQGGRERR